MDRIDLSALETRVERSIQLLHRTFQTSPTGGGGWYHDLESGPPGPSATSVGLACMVLIARTDTHVADALAFLRARQVDSTDVLLDGGWAVNTSAGVPVTECTALVSWLLARARCFLTGSGPDMARALRWLVHNQNPDGGWGSLRGQPSRTWLTAIAVLALAQLAPRHEAGRRGVGWLTGPGVANGEAWGERPGKPPTMTHTAFALTALVEAGAALDHAVVERGYRWLEANIDPRRLHDDAARFESYNVNLVRADGSALTWVSALWHPGLPYAVSALARGPQGAAGPAFFRAVVTIIAAQRNDGRWPGTDSAAQASIWDVWPYLDALSDVMAGPLVRKGDALTLLAPGAVIVQREAVSGTDPVRILAVAARSRRRALLKRHWASLLLLVSVLAAVTAAVVGWLTWTEVAWGLGIPLLLLVIQEARQRRP
jgi:hypothetical protein